MGVKKGKGRGGKGMGDDERGRAERKGKEKKAKGEGSHGRGGEGGKDSYCGQKPKKTQICRNIKIWGFCAVSAYQGTIWRALFVANIYRSKALLIQTFLLLGGARAPP